MTKVIEWGIPRVANIAKQQVIQAIMQRVDGIVCAIVGRGGKVNSK